MLARQPSTPQAIAERARIVLACADEQTNTAVADRLGVSGETVGKWRRRFVELRMTGWSMRRGRAAEKSARLAMTSA
ncbi:MAG TPA: helix-turn-helix domain-containing protein [Actinomycetes bacterium]|nr:helix-turn-helix domain-containing protein [Actinomycetes bacterium]